MPQQVRGFAALVGMCWSGFVDPQKKPPHKDAVEMLCTMKNKTFTTFPEMLATASAQLV